MCNIESYKNMEAKTIEEKLCSIDNIDNAIKILKEYKAGFEEDILLQMKEESVKEVAHGQNIYFVSVDKKARYNSSDILNMMLGDDVEVKKQAFKTLPLNPTFKKTEVRTLEEMTGAKLYVEELAEVLKYKLKSVPKILRGN